MPIRREKKESIVKELQEKLSRAKILFFTDYRGLEVKDMNFIRKELRKNQVDFHVAKKTLLTKAFTGVNVPINLKELEGQVAVVLGYHDEVKAPELVYRFFKESGKLNILGGYLEGREVSKDEIIALAKLPSREVLLGRLAFLVASPMTQFVNVLQGNMRNLVVVLQQIESRH